MGEAGSDRVIRPKPRSLSYRLPPQARERAGLTQREMAERLGCSQQAISQAERWTSNPTIDFMETWARAAGQELVLDLSPGPGFTP